MDEAGLDVQVISLASPGLHNLPADEASRLQVETNDRIAELVNAHPDRFQGFATLATPAPAAAAQELERAVTQLGLNGAPCSAAPVSATSTTPTAGRSSRPLHHSAPRCTSTCRSRTREYGLRYTRASTTPSTTRSQPTASAGTTNPASSSSGRARWRV